LISFHHITVHKPFSKRYIVSPKWINEFVLRIFFSGRTRLIIVVDDEDRENEGDLIIASQFVTPEAINFMATHGRGLICLTLTEARCQQLNLPLMVQDNRAPHRTAFTVSIEAAEGVTTGISAHDRSRTVQAAVAANARPSDIVQPGHIFPLMAQNGGVLVRAGHTEAG
jgi:3,4-dihydroxy 2-butanone 4-phosphate synthase/GTP cyclohydrolase II